MDLYKPSKKKVLLSNRDYLILTDLFFNKGLSLNLLRQKFFIQRHKTTASKRMNILNKGGYVEKHAFFEKVNFNILYFVTPKGLNVIEKKLFGKVIRKELKGSNPEHDLEISKIHYKLLSARNLVECKLENEIQSVSFGILDDQYEPFRRLNSDIYAKIKINDVDYKIAFEYERTQKESKRWSEYLLNYHLEADVNLVLYICADQTIESGLQKIEMELSKSYGPKVFFCTSKCFFENESFAIFSNPNGKNFKLNFQS
jgi:hypothetical protein